MLKKIIVILLLLIAAGAIAAWLACPENHAEERSVQGRQIINLSRAEAWSRLRDLTQAHFYVPDLVRTEITTDRKTGLGTSRRVYQSADSYINETVVGWNEGSGFTLELQRDDGTAPFPFQRASFSYRLRDYGANQTLLETGLHYEIGRGCMGYWMDKLLKSEFQKRIDQVAGNLKQFYETGKPLYNN